MVIVRQIGETWEGGRRDGDSQGDMGDLGDGEMD